MLSRFVRNQNSLTTKKDVKRVAKVLKEVYGVREANVAIMLDSIANVTRPTLMVVAKKLQEMAHASGSEDTLMLYFNGHGEGTWFLQMVINYRVHSLGG